MYESTSSLTYGLRSAVHLRRATHVTPTVLFCSGVLIRRHGVNITLRRLVACVISFVNVSPGCAALPSGVKLHAPLATTLGAAALCLVEGLGAALEHPALHCARTLTQVNPEPHTAHLTPYPVAIHPQPSTFNPQPITFNLQPSNPDS